jgi:hypothetical protein
VVQPDRVRPLAGLSDVLHVSARNWSSARDASRTESDVPHAVTTAVAVKACDR